MPIDVVMPARDESETIAGNIDAAKGCRFVRDVIVVDDRSEDGTAEIGDVRWRAYGWFLRGLTIERAR